MEDYSSILLLKSTCLLGLDSIRFIGYGKFRRAQEYLASCVLCQQSIDVADKMHMQILFV